METAERKSEVLPAEVLATVSHELRSPLASIKGYVSTLLSHEHELSPQERQEFLVAISLASSRLENIVDQLLELSHLETRTIAFHPVPVNLTSLVQEAFTAAKQFRGNETPQEAILSAQDAVTYTLHLERGKNGTPADNGLLVQGDRRLLRRMLDHLLENAVLYSPRGGQIEVGVRALFELQAQQQGSARTTFVLPAEHLEGQALAEIWVTDHGIGIPIEQLQPIFERFYRIDTRLSRQVNGLGLGLSICREIAQLHGGTIWVKSEVGTGSTFHVLLPGGRTMTPDLL